jgi:hypothetical protein
MPRFVRLRASALCTIAGFTLPAFLGCFAAPAAQAPTEVPTPAPTVAASAAPTPAPTATASAPVASAPSASASTTPQPTAAAGTSTGGVTATVKADGAVVAWPAASGYLKGYSVYRSAGGAAPVLVNTAPVTSTKLFDAGLVAGTTYRYTVSALPVSGPAVPLSGAATVVAADPLAPYAQAIAATCPSPTTRVSTAEGLKSALAVAKPGQVIWLEAGVYSGNFKLERGGTATSRIWICGSRSAILDGGTKDKNTALTISGASYVGLSGFTVRNALQGVMVKNSPYVTVAGLKVTDIGYEGIHLYSFSSNGVVRDNDISDTGSKDVAYGEGIYIGTSDQRWSVVTAGKPDATNRTVVLRNTITDAGAEPIEAKPGTVDGIIQDNVISGHQPGSRALGWVLVTGNNWLVRGNQGLDAVTNGITLMKNGTEWGHDNSVVNNRGVADASGWGVLVQKPGSPLPEGAVVGCDNRITGAASGVTHVSCQN